VETVGSVYVVSCGAPEPCAPGVDPAELLCVVALRCRDAVLNFDADGEPVRALLGLHVGPIVGAFLEYYVCDTTAVLVRRDVFTSDRAVYMPLFPH